MSTKGTGNSAPNLNPKFWLCTGFCLGIHRKYPDFESNWLQMWYLHPSSHLLKSVGPSKSDSKTDPILSIGLCKLQPSTYLSTDHWEFAANCEYGLIFSSSFNQIMITFTYLIFDNIFTIYTAAYYLLSIDL